MGQALAGEESVKNCSVMSGLTTVAIILGILGMILVVTGFVKKKDHDTKTEIIIKTVILSILAFVGFLVILPFPYGLAGSIIAPIIIAIIFKKKLSRASVVSKEL